jgi:iron complex outermembrane recepter protein
VVGSGLLPTGSAGLEVTNGFVTDAHFQLANLGYQETSGLDLSLSHYLPRTKLGRISIFFDATHLLKFDRQASVNSPVEKLAGDYRYPKTIASTKLRWRNDGWSASVTAKYTGAYLDDPAPRTLQTLGLPADSVINVASIVTFDTNLSYDVSDKSSVSLTIRNLFDKEPPLVLGSTANVDLYNHDLVGRFVTVRMTHSF